MRTALAVLVVLLGAWGVGAWGAGAGGAAAQELPADVTAVQIPWLMSDPEVTALFATCPGDAFRTRVPVGAVPERSDGACESDLSDCIDRCRFLRDGEACLDAAHALQETLDEVDREPSERLFSLACAAGEPSGCTNRGGTIRNIDGGFDPIAQLIKRPREECLFRTFAVACREDDAWGCAMLGQAHAEGEGTVVDPDAARVAFGSACRSAGEDGDSCRFARRRQAELGPR